MRNCPTSLHDLHITVSRNKNISFPLIVAPVKRVPSASAPTDALRRLVERVVFLTRLFVLLLAFDSEFFRHTESFKKHSFFLFKFVDHHLLSFPFFKLFFKLFLLELLELLQSVQKVHLSLLMRLDMLHSDSVGLF